MTFEELEAKRKQAKENKDETKLSYEKLEAQRKNRDWGRSGNAVLTNLSNTVTRSLTDFDSYLNEYKNRFSDDSYKGDSGAWLTKTDTAIEKLKAEYNKIQRTFDTYGEYLDKDYMDNVNKIYSSYLNYANDVSGVAGESYKYWSQFKTEDDYNNALATKAMLDYDSEAGKKEIDSLSEILAKSQEASKSRNNTSLDDLISAYRRAGYGIKSEEMAKNRMDEIEESNKKVDDDVSSILKSSGYDTIDALQNAISEKTTYYNQAKNLQVSNNYETGAKSSSDFALYSGIGAAIENPDYNFGGMLSPVRNKVTYYRENINAIRANNLRSGGMNEDAEAVAKMTDDEVSIYNYYLAKEQQGLVAKGTADGYLNSIKDALNYRVAQGRYSDIENNTALELAFGASAGFDQFVTGVKNLKEQFTGNSDHIATSAIQYEGGMIREDLADNGFKILGSSVGQIGYDTISTIANMFPTIAISYATSGLASTFGASARVAQTIGEISGNIALGVSAGGNTYAELLNSGLSKDQARAVSIASGTWEAASEYLLGSIEGLAGGFISNKLKNTKISKKITAAMDKALLSNADKASIVQMLKYGAVGMVKGLIDGAVDMSSEGFEEVIQDIGESVIYGVMTGKWEFSSLQEQAYNFTLGALTAFAMNAPKSGVNAAKSVGDIINARQIGSSEIDTIKQIGKTYSADTIAYKLADKVTDKTGAWTLSQLLNKLDATLSEQNKADIKYQLEKCGMAETDAESISEWLANAVAGDLLTPSQRKTLENNPVVSKVFRETIIDQNSTVNQRLTGLANLENEVAKNKIVNSQTMSDEAKQNALAEFDDVDTKYGVDTAKLDESSKLENLGKPLKYNAIVRQYNDKQSIENAAARDLEKLRNPSYTENMDKEITEVAKASNALYYKTVTKDVSDKVSKTNKTTVASTGEEVSIKKIKSISNGNMKLELSNGTTVNSKDIQYKSNGEALIYESVLSTGYSVDTANAIVSSYNALDGVSASNFMLGVDEAYKYGKIGYPLEKINSKGFYSDLTEAQQRFAYKLGQDDARIETTASQIAVNSKKGDTAVKKGRVHLDSSFKSLTPRQQASISAIGRVVAETTHNEVYVFESVVKDGKRVFSKDIAGHKAGTLAPNGFYDAKTGVIYIDLNAGNGGEGVMLYTAAHELTHFIRQWSPVKFKTLADFLMSEYGKADVNIQSLVQDQISKAKKAGRSISFDTAYEEVVADAMQTLFTDTKLSEKLAKLKVKDKSLWQKIKDFFADLYKRIAKAYKGLDPQSQEAMYVRDMKDSIKKISDLFAEALTDAGESYGSIKDAVLKDNDILLHNRFVEPHIDLIKDKYDASSADIELDTLLQRYNRIINIWRKLGGELNSKFLDDWNNQEYKDRAFTVFKSQQGYKYNAELSSMCKKGIPLFEAIDKIVKTEVMNQLKTKTLGKAEKEILYDILKEKGFEIPCAICYVEQARQREGTIIHAFLNGKVETDNNGKTTKFKLGWNQVLDMVEKRMGELGVDYSFEDVSRNIATDNYSPATITMDEKTQEAFYEALLQLCNEEIERYNRDEKPKNPKQKIKSSSPADVNAVLKGSLGSNFKIFKILFNDANSRFKIGDDLLYSSLTTKNLAVAHSSLYSLFNSQGGVSGYKTKQGTVVYLGDILKKKWASAQTKKEGGIRNQSNSDFMMYTLLDQAQIYIDLSAKGYYLHAYTKVLAELKLFGLSKSKINASLIPAVHIYKDANGNIDIEKTRKYAGLDADGNPIYDDIEGINHKEAFMLLSDAEYSKNCSGICIGYSDEHIMKLLDDNKVQLIIGFHDKTDDPDKRYKGAKYAKNYNGLNEAVKVNADGTTETVHIGFNQFVIKAEKLFKQNSDGDFEGVARYNGQSYLADDIPKLATDMYREHCESKHLVPAYHIEVGVDANGNKIYMDDHPNYYKLLGDFGLRNSEGHYAPHKKVQFNMPESVPYLEKGVKKYMKTEDYIKQELIKELKVRDDIANALSDESEDGIIPRFVKQVNELYDDVEGQKNSDRNQENPSLKTLNGSKIQRSKYGVGKQMGDQIYVHKNYANEIVPADVLSKAESLLPKDFSYNCIMYNVKKPSEVRFDEAPDFDTAREPKPGKMLTVNVDDSTVTPTKGNGNMIWHHKWQWVRNDYKGFDVQESYNWSKQWLQYISNPSGSLRVWNEALRENGLTVDSEDNTYYSLREVEPVQPSSDSWHRGLTTEELVKRGFPIWHNVDESNLSDEAKAQLKKQEKTGDKTQRDNQNTYIKVGNLIKNGFLNPDDKENWKNLRILDASSGKGTGTNALRKMGLNVTDIEPFAPAAYQTDKGVPDYTDYDVLQGRVESGEVDPFDYILCNAVINVLPQDQQDALLKSMDAMLRSDGKGKMFINVLNPEYEQLIKAKDDADTITKSTEKKSGATLLTEGVKGKVARQVFVWTSNSVQKGFYFDELEAYINDTLDNRYEVVKTPSKANIGMMAVFATKKSEEVKYSDREYLELAKNPQENEARLREMVGEAAKNAGYIDVIRYHQTGRKFTRFSNENPDAALNDSDTPNGYFFKDNDHDIGVGADYVNTGHGGNIQMPVYLKSSNMLYFKNRYEAQEWYAKNVPGYGELLQRYKKHLDDYEAFRKSNNSAMFDELNSLDEKYQSQYGQSLTEQEEEILDRYDKIADEYLANTSSEETELRSGMRKLLNDYFIENDSGYDGIELADDGHRYIDMRREDVHTYIVFKNSQIKSADPVTYDDQGNIIPLSERFKSDNEDIRYSDRDLSNTEQKATEIFGTTDDFAEAGYILPNGKMLDFSKKETKGDRDYDHRAIGLAYGYDIDLNKNHGFDDGASKYLEQFVEDGNIRLEPGVLDLNMNVAIQMSGSVPPTKAQINAIRELVRWNAEREETYVTPEPSEDEWSLYRGLKLVVEFGADAYNHFGDEGQRANMLVYNGKQASPEKVVADIRHYYETGEIRQQSGIMQFHYSDRNPDATDNRTLLSNALATTAQNEIEKKYIEQYQEKIDTINEEQKKLADLRAKIKELSFAKGPRDAKQISELQAEATKTANRINTFDKQLLKLETAKPLQEVLSREKLKAKQRAEKKAEKALKAYRAKTERTQKELMSKYKERIKNTYREKSEQAQKDLADKYRERIHKGVVGRSKTQVKNRIKSVVKEMDALLNRGTKDRNVKVDMRDTIAQAIDTASVLFSEMEARDIILNGITSVTPAEQKLIEKYRAILDDSDAIAEQLESMDYPDEELTNQLDKNYAKLKEVERKLNNVVVRERSRLQETAVGEAIQKLADAYKAMLTVDKNHVHYSYQKEVYDKLTDLKESLGGTTVGDMTLEQTEKVLEAYKLILHTVKTANKIFRENQLISTSEIASAFSSEILANNKQRDERSTIRIGGEEFLWNELKPLYAFRYMNSKTAMKLYHDFEIAENTWGKDVAEAKEYADEIRGKYNYSKWDFDKPITVKLHSEDVELNLEKLLSIFAYSKREQALEHMSEGGFLLNSKEAFKKVIVKDGKTKKSVLEYVSTKAKAFRVNELDLKNIAEKYLTEEQKNYVTDMVTFLTAMGEKGNEASRILYGIDLFKEVWYFPLTSASDFVFTANAPAGEVSLKNAGMTKEVVPHATNPIVLENFDDVWAKHVGKMSTYHSFVVPIDNFNKVYNHTDYRTSNSSDSVKSIVGSVFGDSGKEYISKLLQDLNGGVSGDHTKSPFARLYGKFKKTAVAASASVIAQQPTAIIRAMAMVDAKYFVGETDKLSHSEKWERLKKYAPVAVIKEIGGLDIGSGRSVMQYLATNKTLADKADDITMRGAGYADELGWNTIYDACIREVADKQKLTGEELLAKAGERFGEVVRHTQVYDSVLSRSGYMRSSNDFVKMSTEFMGEPTTSVNMTFDALLQAKRGTMTKSQAARTISFVVLASMAANIVKSLVGAARKDDDDESYINKFVKVFAANAMDELFIPNQLPFVKDIVTIIQGGSIERTDLSLIQDLYDAFNSLSSENKSWYRKIEDFGGAIGNMFGFPAKNIMRDLRSAYNLIKAIFDDVTPHNVGKDFIDAVWSNIAETVTFGKYTEPSASDEIYKALMRGDSEYIARAKKNYKTASAYQSAVRKGLKENDDRIEEAAKAKASGDMATFKSIVLEIKAEGRFSQDDIVSAINSKVTELSKETETESETKWYESESAETKIDGSVYTTSDINSELESGDTVGALNVINDIIKAKVTQGKTEKEARSSIQSSLTSYWKDKYLEAYKAGNSSEMARIRRLLDSTGVYKNIVETAQNWVKSSKN